MSEEFKPIRITLSEEAFDKLKKITQDAKFRSYSSAIEECVRVVSDIITDLTLVLGPRGKPWTPFNGIEAADTFEKIATRMSRFTGRIIMTGEQAEKLGMKRDSAAP